MVYIYYYMANRYDIYIYYNGVLQPRGAYMRHTTRSVIVRGNIKREIEKNGIAAPYYYCHKRDGVDSVFSVFRNITIYNNSIK